MDVAIRICNELFCYLGPVVRSPFSLKGGYLNHTPIYLVND